MRFKTIKVEFGIVCEVFHNSEHLLNSHTHVITDEDGDVVIFPTAGSMVRCVGRIKDPDSTMELADKMLPFTHRVPEDYS